MTNKCRNWRSLHKIIDKDKRMDLQNKQADKELVFEWDSFSKIRGKTFGDVRNNTLKNIGVYPSILAITYRDHKCGAEKYIKSKYLGEFK